jgi:AraC family ethanolamine operon transcriptional activator
MTPNIAVRQFEFSDPEALVEAVPDGPSEVVQLERGSMRGQLEHLSVGRLGVARGSFTRAVRGRGIPSERRWVFYFFTSPGVVQHCEVAPGDLFLLAPGHEHYASFPDGGGGYTAVLAAPDLLFEFVDSKQPGARDAVIWRRPSTILEGAISHTTAAAVSTLLAAIRDPTLPDDAVVYYKRCLLDLITAPVLNRAIKYREPLLLSPVELVRRAERFTDGAGPRPVHISELWKALNVSERTLYRAFKAVHGLPPAEYMRRKRLSDVRRALLAASGPDAMVGTIASAHGFLQLGRFADYYRKMFDEYPHQTLRRPPLQVLDRWTSR